MKNRFFARMLSLLLIAAMLCPLALAEEKAEVAVTLPKSLVTIDAEAFMDTAAFGKVIVQDKTRRIESRAFANSAAKEIHLPASVEYIADDAFEGCENLTLYVPQGSYAHKWAAFSDVKYVVVSDPATVEKYALSGLEFADGIAKVNVTTDAACVLRVNVLQESDESVLLSYTAAAEAGLQAAALEVSVTGTLPAYFILEAVLEDAKGNALCEPLRDIRRSQAYANAMAAEPTDYPAERVIDFGDAGYMVLAEGVTNITENVTVSGDNYTIPTSAFGGELPEVGDVLMLNVSGTPTPVKVGSVAPSKGDSIRIEADSEIYMCDAFDKIDVNGYVEADESGIGAGVGGEIPLDETYTSEGGKLTVKATGGVSVYVNAQYDKQAFSEDYFMFDAEARVVVDIVGTVSDKYEIPQDKIKLDLYAGKIIIPGVNLPADLKITLPLNGYIEGTGSLSFHYEKMAGFTWDTDNGFVEKEEPNKNSADAQLQVDFNVNAGPKVALTMGLWKFFTVTVDAQVGVTADGKLTGKAHAGYVAPVDDDEIHACNLCLGIDVNIFATGNATVTYKITKKLSDSLSADIFYWDTDLMDMHWSLINDADSYYKGVPTKALGTCPNYQYKVKVSTKDINGKTVKGLPVTIKSSAGTLHSFTSPGECHLYTGAYTGEAEFKSGVSASKFSVSGAPKSVVIEEEPISITVQAVDAQTKRVINNAQVSVTLPDGSVRKGNTGYTGSYTFENLPGGKYSITVSADNYETKKDTGLEYAPGYNINYKAELKFNGELPWIYAEYISSGGGRVQMLDSSYNCPAGVPEIWVSLKTNSAGTDVVYIEHEDCEDPIQIELTGMNASFVSINAANMGENEYVYLLSAEPYSSGDGYMYIVFRVNNGAAEILGVFSDYGASMDASASAEGTFSSAYECSGTMQPTGIAFKMTANRGNSNRTGCKLYTSDACGYVYRKRNDNGYYDLISQKSMHYKASKVETFGSLETRYIM